MLGFGTRHEAVPWLPLGQRATSDAASQVVCLLMLIWSDVRSWFSTKSQLAKRSVVNAISSGAKLGSGRLQVTRFRCVCGTNHRRYIFLLNSSIRIMRHGTSTSSANNIWPEWKKLYDNDLNWDPRLSVPYWPLHNVRSIQSGGLWCAWRLAESPEFAASTRHNCFCEQDWNNVPVVYTPFGLESTVHWCTVCCHAMCQQTAARWHDSWACS